MPPEAIENKFNDKRSDLYSLGATIFQILTGFPPFAAGSEYLVYTRVQKRDLRLPPGMSKGTKITKSKTYKLMYKNHTKHLLFKAFSYFLIVFVVKFFVFNFFINFVRSKESNMFSDAS